MVEYRINGSGEVKREVRHYWVVALWQGWEDLTYGAFPRLLKLRGNFLYMQYVLQIMHEMRAARNCLECHMLEVEGGVRNCAPGIWSD